MPPKSWRPPTRPHGATNKKAKNSIFTAVKGFNLIFHLITVCSVYGLYIRNIMHEGTKRTVLQSGTWRKRKESSIRGNVR
jgi:hypothetical protein